MNGDDLALSNLRIALLSRNLHIATAHDDFRLVVGVHDHTEAAAFTVRMNGYVRSIDFCVGFAAAEYVVVGDALADLYLDLITGNVRDRGLRPVTETQHVSEIELHFGARVVSS